MSNSTSGAVRVTRISRRLMSMVAVRMSKTVDGMLCFWGRCTQVVQYTATQLLTQEHKNQRHKQSSTAALSIIVKQGYQAFVEDSHLPFISCAKRMMTVSPCSSY